MKENTAGLLLRIDLDLKSLSSLSNCLCVCLFGFFLSELCLCPVKSTFCSFIPQIKYLRHLSNGYIYVCCHNNLLPPLFFNLFLINSQIHGCSTRTANKYRVRHCLTNLQKFTILYLGPKI